jgi:purine nucleosidase
MDHMVHPHLNGPNLGYADVGGVVVSSIRTKSSASVVAHRAAAANSSAPPLRIIIDSDFKTMSDDGQVLAMAAQLQAQSALQIMGLCVVSGNDWQPQEVAEALRAVERLGVENTVGVYPGADAPLDRDVVRARAQAVTGNGYPGAFDKPWPAGTADLLPPPDGFATHTAVTETSAVDFIADTVRAHPHEITLLAIGPLTDIAAATTAHPDIVALIKEIVYMGGAFDVPGNTPSIMVPPAQIWRRRWPRLEALAPPGGGTPHNV